MQRITKVGVVSLAKIMGMTGVLMLSLIHI